MYQLSLKDMLTMYNGKLSVWLVLRARGYPNKRLLYQESKRLLNQDSDLTLGNALSNSRQYENSQKR